MRLTGGSSLCRAALDRCHKELEAEVGGEQEAASAVLEEALARDGARTRRAGEVG